MNKVYRYNPSTEYGEFGHLQLKQTVEKPIPPKGWYVDPGCTAREEMEFRTILEKYSVDQELIRKSILPVSQELYNKFQTDKWKWKESGCEFIADKDFIIIDGKAFPVTGKNYPNNG